MEKREREGESEWASERGRGRVTERERDRQRLSQAMHVSMSLFVFLCIWGLIHAACIHYSKISECCEMNPLFQERASQLTRDPWFASSCANLSNLCIVRRLAWNQVKPSFTLVHVYEHCSDTSSELSSVQDCESERWRMWRQRKWARLSASST